MNTDDPRHGLPSGSNALYDALCHGRWQLQKQWDAQWQGEQEEVSNDTDHSSGELDMDNDAAAGRRIHKLYAGLECPEARPAEIERAEQGRQVDKNMLGKWLSTFESLEPLPGPIQEYREKRWWLKDEEGKEVYSGQTDVVWIMGKPGEPAHCLLGDLKGLWGDHDQSPINMQLRRYIALIAANIQELGFSALASAAAYLNQPAVYLVPFLTRFSEDDIAQFSLEMWSDLAAITDPDAERIAGPVQCKHCRAKLICDAYEKEQDNLQVIISPDCNAVPAKSEVLAAIRSLPDSSLSRLLEWLPAFANAIDLAKIVAKDRLKSNPECMPDWRLKPNTPREKIADPLEVFLRLKNKYDMPAEDFICGTQLSKDTCRTWLRVSTGRKGKLLEGDLDALLEGLTAPIAVAASLERVKG